VSQKEKFLIVFFLLGGIVAIFFSPLFACPVRCTLSNRALADVVDTSAEVVSFPAPANLLATAVSTTEINLSWSAVSEAVSYKVYRAGVLITFPTTTSYSDTGLTPETTYSYTVSAVNSLGGESSQSSPVSATTLSGGGGGISLPVSVTCQGNILESLGGEVRCQFGSGQITKVIFPSFSVRGTAVVKIEPQNKIEIIKTKPLPRNLEIIGDLIGEFKAFSGIEKIESFDKEVWIAFTYNDEQVREAKVDEKTLSIYFWDDSKRIWQPVPKSYLDPISNTITVPTLRFSLFAVIGEKPIIERIKEIPEKIKEGIKEISEKTSELAKKVAELIKPKPPKVKLPEIPIEEIVPKEVPLALKGKWQLLPTKPIQEFVLAPLPREIGALVKKFPELEKVFREVGITTITDISKLEGVKLTLPGLTERVGLILPIGIPIAKLSPETKEKMPTDILFCKTGGEKIDFNITLTVEKGKPIQRINTISDSPLICAIKPDKPVERIRGYVVFKAKSVTSIFPPVPLTASLIDSLFFTKPAFAILQKEPIEEKLVLIEFEYTDPDGDGIYTAEIRAPKVEGEYEIVTVMDYEDPSLGKKEIRLITVVDPEGYVFEKYRGREMRIAGAKISLYWQNPETKNYQLWSAKEFLQENPKVTDSTGKYAFLVPPGSYYLKVEAKNYLTFQGEPFEIKEGSGIHFNIELKPKWWLRIVDWRIVTLIFGIVILLLFYKIYRDKIRKKLLLREKYE